MRLHQFVVPALVLAVGLAACEDSKEQPAVTPPTAPAATESLLTPDDAPNAALALEKSIVSVCKAYRKAGAQLKKDLLKNPSDEDLKAQVKALKAMTDDACN
jgi:hypothetical protein